MLTVSFRQKLKGYPLLEQLFYQTSPAMDLQEILGYVRIENLGLGLGVGPGVIFKVRLQEYLDLAGRPRLTPSTSTGGLRSQGRGIGRAAFEFRKIGEVILHGSARAFSGR